VGIIFFSFYEAFVLFTAVATMDFGASGVVSLPSDAGDAVIDIEIPGLGGLPLIVRATVQALFLAVMIFAGSKIAERGADLLKA